MIVERYVLWLNARSGQGDVLAESRGGKEDRRLKDSFERVCEKGSEFIKPEQFAARLTSRQLKVKNKTNNIAGLQIADLLAHPSFRATLARHECQALPGNFGGEIAKSLRRASIIEATAGRLTDGGENGCHKIERPRRARRRKPSTSRSLDWLQCMIERR